MSTNDTWRVEIAYATPAHQEIIEISTSPGATIEEVIRRSDILTRFPEIDLVRHRVGIFGEVLSLQEPVRDRDRIEIYRPLIAGPKEMRRRRAARRGKAKTPKKKL